jgi:hypothetical protein
MPQMHRSVTGWVYNRQLQRAKSFALSKVDSLRLSLKRLSALGLERSEIDAVVEPCNIGVPGAKSLR